MEGINPAGFETEQRKKLEKRLAAIEATQDDILSRLRALETPSEGEEDDKAALVEEAIRLKLAAPSVIKRWSRDKLLAEIEAKKASHDGS